MMQVVVLPTPPFWLAIANTLAMLPFPLNRATQYQQMALTLATGNLEHVGCSETEVRWQCLQLIVRMHAFHCQPLGLGIAKVARPVGKIFQ